MYNPLVSGNSNTHQGTYGGGFSDGFLAKFNQNGVRLWGTYYGGEQADQGKSCAGEAFAVNFEPF